MTLRNGLLPTSEIKRIFCKFELYISTVKYAYNKRGFSELLVKTSFLPLSKTSIKINVFLLVNNSSVYNELLDITIAF